VKHEPTKQFNVAYFLFLVPIALAFLSWAYFPAGAQWVTKNVFGYNPLQQVANPVWLLFIGFFGAAGFFAMVVPLLGCGMLEIS
jgi:hypothetical protein